MFESGRQKTGGRQKGTPNKVNQELLKKCEEAGVDVFKGLLEIARSNRIEFRFKALSELAQYLYPKRKALDISLSDLDDAELIAEAQARLESSETE